MNAGRYLERLTPLKTTPIQLWIGFTQCLGHGFFCVVRKLSIRSGSNLPLLCLEALPNLFNVRHPNLLHDLVGNPSRYIQQRIFSAPLLFEGAHPTDHHQNEPGEKAKKDEPEYSSQPKSACITGDQVKNQRG